MNDTVIRAQYSTGLSRSNIEQALIAAGKDIDRLQPSDLALLEDFHTMGRIATSQLVNQIGITSGNTVLDAGSGIGGTARYVADQCGCRVTAVDLTEEYCKTATWLNQLVGLDEQICVRQADVTGLPFADASFDVVFSQHVQMNVADKAGLYREARRVLVSGGRLALWDITVGERGEPDYPLPWADRPEVGYLISSDQLRVVVETSGFAVEHWSDLSGQAASMMQMMMTLPPNPLGLHAFVTDFAEKAQNLTLALADGRLRAIQGVARATNSNHIVGSSGAERPRCGVTIGGRRHSSWTTPRAVSPVRKPVRCTPAGLAPCLISVRTLMWPPSLSSVASGLGTPASQNHAYVSEADGRVADEERRSLIAAM